jgi:hypothetical protein
MKPEVVVWVAFARQTQGLIEQAIQGFEVLSETYSPMRDVGFEPEEKEAIDLEYSRLNDLRGRLAEVQAGGARKKRKTRKNRS